METVAVSRSKAVVLQSMMNAANANRLRVGPEFCAVKAKANAMLVDPLNGDPFVFVPPATAYVFQFKPGSGTDHLRQRTLADLFYEGLPSGNQ